MRRAPTVHSEVPVASEDLIFDRVDDTVLALADPVPVLSGQLLATRARAYIEDGRRPNHPAMIRPLAIRAAQASPNTAPYP